jgi:hypothetical protein
LILGVLLIPMIGSGSSPAGAADFDKDGYSDLAIGVEWEEVGGHYQAGAVNILYGTANGISAADDQIWTQNDLATPDESENIDHFGQVLAAGDFNGDGAADLAVGVPGEDVDGKLSSGAVQILYGTSPQGFVAMGTQFWHQNSPDVVGVAEEGDLFGSALAVGDFDGDGYDDLAVGAFGESVGAEDSAGAVSVLYGTAVGLSALGNQIWFEGYNGLGGVAEADDWFGAALAAGDFDGDGRDDLAIGIKSEDMGEGAGLISDAGRVVVLYGTATGLSAAGSQSWDDDVHDVVESKDYFGETLATGDFDGDGYADLAIGTPREDLVLTLDAGRVVILYGSPGGLTSEGNQGFTLEDYTNNDRYAYALVAGDFNGDGFDELAVGIPYEDWYALGNIGAVEILYGASGGLYRRSGWDDVWSQARAEMVDDAEPGDLFGYALAAGDFDNDGYADLAVGIREEDIGTSGNAGAVQILYGSANGIAVVGTQFWHQDSFEDGYAVEDFAEPDDHFGCALAAIPVKRSPLPPPPPPQLPTIFLPLVLNNN